jgi:rSAM/selenodomain-associated transferase 2/rSAM/selenodomain-associated transferase 1
MSEEPLVSVIIPVWRDHVELTNALHRLRPTDKVEVVVAGVLGEESRDASVREQHPGVRWVAAPRGRAAQMNAGAAMGRGRWLLFLHADSQLPADWLAVIAEADLRSCVGGAFALGLDSRDWRARVIECGVRVRVAMFGLPYGDQALFVRRDIFATLNGYRDLPLMEDVDFVRRVKDSGRLLKSQAVVTTSARRWERDGWMRRSARNVGLAARFLAGGSPAQLAQRYFGRRAAGVVMMARAPWTGGKTRLGVAADEGERTDLRHALFLDTLDAVISVADVEHIVACEPAHECERLRQLVGPAVDVIAQRGDDLGRRMAHVFEDSFRLGVASVVVVGSDLPDLPSRLIREALDALRGREDRVVIGPASDGGYYLIGLNRPHPTLFDRIDWSTARVLAQTREAANALGLQVQLLDEWTDVDDAADLNRLMRDSPESGAPRTRAWSLEHHKKRPEAEAPGLSE